MSVNRIHALQSELGSGYEADDGERGPLLGGGGGGGGEEGYYGTNNSNNTNNNIRSSLSSPTSATNLLRDFKRKELALLLSPAARLERTMALALAGFGVCFMAVSLYMQFFGGSGGSSPGH